MNSINKSIAESLCRIVGEDFVIEDLDKKQSYLYDQVMETVRPAANENSIVVKPSCTDEISKIMRLANDNAVPVVVRGGGTGLSGGAIPVRESIVMSMERLNNILEVDRANMVAVLEPGVTLADIIEEMDNHQGIWFPAHPGDEGAHIGGMAATNAGGSRAVKHGVMRKHIQGMEVVLANGEVVNLGGKLVKDNAGYNLMNLIIGSDGTLAVITKVILRLYPEEKYSGTIIASFESLTDASAACLEIIASGSVPLAVEYQDRDLWRGTARMVGRKWQLEKGDADIMIIVSEPDEEKFYSTCRRIYEVCKKNKACEQYFAGKKSEQADLLKIRSQMYEFSRQRTSHAFDMAVPVGQIAAFLGDLRKLFAKYDTTTNITAHVADGNIHNDILLINGKTAPYVEELKTEMYALCFSYGGTITGEHGVGKLRRKDLTKQKSETELALMRGIKHTFDPKGILNPDTLLESTCLV
ncbi:MAG: FAD-binding oxidoreductase [Defluviitaleaceae bacterium]|nr:FAD-binding oxidoreductase [Defluviitaleaceae bacterium]